MKEYKLGLVLGRFQLFHKGHELIIDTALNKCEKVLIFIGSSDKEGTFKNPFNYEFRKKIIEEVYPNNKDIIVAPLPDLGVGDVPVWGQYVINSAIKAIGMPDCIIYGAEDKCEHWYTDYQDLAYLRVDRSEIEISSTKLKEIIVNDDYELFKKYVNDNIVKYYDIIRKTLLKLCPRINLSDYGIELHLVRHGKDDKNMLGGWSDNHLTDEGINQIKALKNEIDTDYDLFISSDLNRAKESSLILNEKLNMNIIYDPNFREVNNGILKNMTKEEFELKYPNLCFSKLKMDECYPGGESPNKFYERISKSFIKLINENRNKKILIVTHGGVIAVILSILKGIEYSNRVKMSPHTGTIAKFK